MVVQSKMFSFFKPSGGGNKGFGGAKKIPAPAENAKDSKTPAVLQKKSEPISGQPSSAVALEPVTPKSVTGKKKRAIPDSDSEDEFELDDVSPKLLKKSSPRDGLVDSDEDDDDYDEGLNDSDDDDDDVSLDDEESEDDEVVKSQKGKKRLSNSSIKSNLSASKKQNITKQTPKAINLKKNIAPSVKKGMSSSNQNGSGGGGTTLLFSPSSSSKHSSSLSPKSTIIECSENNENKNDKNEFTMSYKHEQWDWYFKPDSCHDLNKNSQTDLIQYNKRTLFVPEKFLSSQTPAQTQWWDLKSKNNDLIFFFKIGKFYELYHGDADIGVREAGLTYMKGDQAHCGFPELGYGRYAELLCSKGYRVARIEQTETVEENKERAKKCPSHYNKIDKILFKATSREICSVLSPGTRTYNHFDTMNHNDGMGEANLAQFLKDMNYVYPTTTILIAIKEIVFPKKSSQEMEDGASQAACEYGICLVDAPTSSVMIGQFHDDLQRTRLRTLLTQYPPAEVLTEKNNVSEETTRILSFMCKSALKDQLFPVQEFWTAEKTKAELCKEGVYFSSIMGKERLPIPEVLSSVCGAMESASLALSALGASCWLLRRALIDEDVFSMGKFSAYCPPDLENNLSQESTLSSVSSSTTTSTSLSSDCELSAEDIELSRMTDALSSPSPQQDEKLLNISPSMKPTISETLPDQCSELSDLYWVVTGQRYSSVEGGNIFSPSKNSQSTSNKCEFGSRMLLDGAALTNLEILLSTDGNEHGSLFKYLNRTNSAFGKRLMKEWVCAPLLHTPEINGRIHLHNTLTQYSYSTSMYLARLDAVQELTEDLSEVEALLKSNLMKLPDLERLLANVHALSSKRRAQDHPDSRARIFDFDKLAKRKVSKFADLLEGMKVLTKLNQSLVECNPKSSLLKSLCLHEKDGGLFPDMSQPLAFFAKSFDVNHAKRTGSIEPKPGMDMEYDEVLKISQTVKQELEQLLDELKKSSLKGSGVHWWHHKTKLEDQYQLEIDANWLKKNSCALSQQTFISKSQTSKFRRFHTPNIVKLLSKLGEANVLQEQCKGDAMRKIFAKFVESGDIWSKAIRCVATLDVLSSLASVSNQYGMTKPVIVNEVDEVTHQPVVVLDFEQARHPCLLLAPGVESIPNSTLLGGDTGANQKPRLLLLTGPNMGGKSTLLRQTCLIAILAQCGCFVPAESARLSPVDRIFTRLGASDRILAGMSTFFVELSEAAAVLNYATDRSLVILDELGRGTSTFDGTAIAHAVVDHLARNIKCRTLFATHYHSLVEEWGHHPDYKQLVSLAHMACVVHSDHFEENKQNHHMTDDDEFTSMNNTAQSQPEEENYQDHPPITFLYTLAEGASPKSFGINVARLACLPLEVIALASKKSSQFELMLNKTQDVDRLIKLAKQLISSLQVLKTNQKNEELTGNEILEIWKQSQAFDQNLFL